MTSPRPSNSSKLTALEAASDSEEEHHGRHSMAGRFNLTGTHQVTGRTRLSKFPTVFGLTLTNFILLSLWLLFLLVAMFVNPGKAWPLTLLTLTLVAGYAMSYSGMSAAICDMVPEFPEQGVWVILGLLGLVMVIIVGIQVIPSSPHRRYRLQSLCGALVLVGGCALCSRKRANIPWRLACAGFATQFFLGFFVLKTTAGFHTFKAMGDGATNFLSFADVGAEFVFGSNYAEHFFAFKVLPVTIFFSAFCSMMYYLGVLQFIVRMVASVLKVLLNSSLTESVNSAGNIFLGQTEAPLLVRPLLPTATVSEIHCIMTGGFATVAGGVLAAYIGMGVNPEQLIGASVMSAPAALTISKILCPDGVVLLSKKDDPSGEAEGEEESESKDGTAEEGRGQLDDDDEDRPPAGEFKFPAPTENNLVEAAGNGASISIGLVANIAAMLIAFLSLISAIDALLGHLGSLVGMPEAPKEQALSFQLICGYLFTPIAWVLGTPSGDCYKVAELIGTKIFINEFVAYSDLAKLLKHEGGRQISERGELVATYALCGFSNVGSIGIQMGGLSGICPERQKVFASLVVSAMLAGNICCFLTATIAGILQ